MSAHQRQCSVGESPPSERFDELERRHRPRSSRNEPRSLVGRLRPARGVVQQPRRAHFQRRPCREAARKRSILRRGAFGGVAGVEEIIGEKGALREERVGVGGACERRGGRSAGGRGSAEWVGRRGVVRWALEGGRGMVRGWARGAPTRKMLLAACSSDAGG